MACFVVSRFACASQGPCSGNERWCTKIWCQQRILHSECRERGECVAEKWNSTKLKWVSWKYETAFQISKNAATPPYYNWHVSHKLWCPKATYKEKFHTALWAPKAQTLEPKLQFQESRDNHRIIVIGVMMGWNTPKGESLHMLNIWE